MKIFRVLIVGIAVLIVVVIIFFGAMRIYSTPYYKEMPKKEHIEMLPLNAIVEPEEMPLSSEGTIDELMEDELQKVEEEINALDDEVIVEDMEIDSILE